MKDQTDDMLCLQDFDETEADFYRLEPPNAPWGDYGSILIHGIAAGGINEAGSPEIQRAGPFVPPITFPGLNCIVVTGAMRDQLRSSGLTGFSFVPALKSRIVPIDWHEWDLLSNEPPFYPEEGEPEAYLSPEQHSPALANEMPDLWRLILAPGATEVRVPEGPYSGVPVQIFIRAGSWREADFFRADTTLYHYVSARARLWLLDLYPAWLSFTPVRLR